jgi:hypothetical protein
MVCQTVALYQSGKGLDGFGLQARRVGACAFKRRVVSYLSFAEQGIQNLVLIMVKHRTINPRLIDDSWNYQAIKFAATSSLRAACDNKRSGQRSRWKSKY